MMSSTLAEAIESLQVAFSESASVMELDRAIAEVAALEDSSSIGQLLGLLDDSAEYDEVMFSLIHAAEAFDDATYVRAFLGVVPRMRYAAPRWASIVLMRILNSQTARKELVSAVREAPLEAKSAIEWLCDAINQKSTEFMSKTVSVLTASRA